MYFFSILNLFILISFIDSVVIKIENLPEKCDYSKCTKWDPKQINVHLVPHTHDDVGWLKTVDQYYYGLKNYIQKAGVQYILDTVIEELIRNKERRFIYVETAFFWKWWSEQNKEIRMVVQELVRTGQLEFINGGWSMPDEATTHYNSLIDQSTWGLRRLNDTFGRCGRPLVTWQIDPFGHSREMASLYAQMGYDALFFAREDYQDRQHRMKTKKLEHVWQGSNDLGKSADIFTGMMMSGYGPIEFNWDIVGGQEDAIVDNPESEEYNVPVIVKRFVQAVKYFAKFYATKNIMFPMGTDFQFQGAHNWFKNLDKLIKHVNEANLGIRTFYSTPSCYTKALHESNHTWTGKTDDYFPYASDENSYWTGYYTSRPALKRMERVGNNILQACKQLDVFASNEGRFEKNITRLREAMGVMQHHDAVSGTEKQHVANNYAKQLHSAMVQCEQVIEQSYKRLFPNNNHQHEFCHFLNESSCPSTENPELISNPLAIHIYNPLAHEIINRTIRLPVRDDLYYHVLDPINNSIPSVLVPIPEYVQKIPGRKSSARKELVFRVNIKPLGMAVYHLFVSKSKSSQSATEVKRLRIIEGILLTTKKDLMVIFDSNGFISKLVYKNKTMKFENTFHYYEGYQGFTRKSGAYIFRPKKQHALPILKSLAESNLYIDEKYGLVQEVHQRFQGSFVDQIIRVDPEKEFIEFEFVIGPIPVHDGIGKEIITRYSTDLENEQIFFTDSNGRQLLKRQWNYRPTWSYEVKEPISGNYYPVNSRIAIIDKKRNLQMTILTDRSQGGSISPNQIGSIDLMVHRRLLYDDGFGVDEALNEKGIDGRGLVIRARHLVLISEPSNSSAKHRPLAQELFMEPILSFTKITKDDNMINSYQAISESLPPNIHLLTLEQWHSNGYLLRLEHFYQRNEDKQLSKPITISLRNLFKTFTIIQVQELTLAAHNDVSALKNRLVFNYKTKYPKDSFDYEDEVKGDNLEIRLEPMQIRTFFIRIKKKNV